LDFPFTEENYHKRKVSSMGEDGRGVFDRLEDSYSNTDNEEDRERKGNSPHFQPSGIRKKREKGLHE